MNLLEPNYWEQMYTILLNHVDKSLQHCSGLILLKLFISEGFFHYFHF